MLLKIFILAGSLKIRKILCFENIRGANLTNSNFREEPLSIYQLSYTLYTLTGLIVVLTVGLIVSYMTGGQDLDKLDPDHLTPPIKYFFLRSRRSKKVAVANSQQLKVNGDAESPKVLQTLLARDGEEQVDAEDEASDRKSEQLQQS